MHAYNEIKADSDNVNWNYLNGIWKEFDKVESNALYEKEFNWVGLNLKNQYFDPHVFLTLQNIVEPNPSS